MAKNVARNAAKSNGWKAWADARETATAAVGGTRWGAPAVVAGDTTRAVAGENIEILAHGAAAEYLLDGAVKDVVKDGVKDGVKDVVISGSRKMLGTQAAKVSLRYTFTNEETIYSEISLRLTNLLMPAIVNRQDAIKKMLDLNFFRFKEMNLGGRCWYLSRVWGLIRLHAAAAKVVAVEAEAAVEAAAECKKFIDSVTKCDDPAVSSFVSWMTGPGFVRADFLGLVPISLRGLLPPLWEAVYDYLAAPAAYLIKREILSLI